MDSRPTTAGATAPGLAYDPVPAAFVMVLPISNPVSGASWDD